MVGFPFCLPFVIPREEGSHVVPAMSEIVHVRTRENKPLFPVDLFSATIGKMKMKKKTMMMMIEEEQEEGDDSQMDRVESLAKAAASASPIDLITPFQSPGLG